ASTLAASDQWSAGNVAFGVAWTLDGVPLRERRPSRREAGSLIGTATLSDASLAGDMSGRSSSLARLHRIVAAMIATTLAAIATSTVLDRPSVGSRRNPAATAPSAAPIVLAAYSDPANRPTA